jgi:transaldolase/glucose-6-phosphate isomerase
MEASLGEYREMVDAALAEMREQHIPRRVWERDHTVWNPEPTEIKNRLGWLDIAERIIADIPEIDALFDEMRRRRYTHAVLLGMGGSSLAPQVFRQTFGVAKGGLDLSVLDSTDPGAVLAMAERHDPRKTLFIVSTKSGGTVETLSFFKYFYRRTVNAVDAEHAGDHFIAITDPGSSLVKLAKKHKFLKTFENDPNIGGRYSALSFFGLVPARLVGVDLGALLQRALTTSASCRDDRTSPAVRLGTIMGELTKAGRDKLTLICSPAIASFGNWVEQLIAESTGKNGTGILPVVGEEPADASAYGDDRLFVHLHLTDDSRYDKPVQVLRDAGHPVVHLRMNDLDDLGGQFFLWEMATAIAGHRLGIHPFDQPNVESAKVRAREMVDAYQKRGKLPELEPSLEAKGIRVYAEQKAKGLPDVLKSFLNKRERGAYIAVQAYLQPSDTIDAALNAFRLKLREHTGLATTVGYGPRFLHSTGQLHKGDAGNGLFIQLTNDKVTDTDIPDDPKSDKSSMSFGVLIAAQALGDRQALLDARRAVIRFHLGKDAASGIATLADAL